MTPRFDRLNPLTLLAAALLLTTAAYLGPAPAAPAIALSLALGGAWWGGVGGRAAALAAGVALPTFLLLGITNGVLASDHVDSALGALRFDGAAVRDARDVALRLGAAIAALGTVVAGVAPRRLTRALAARGLPGWAAYLIVASLEAAPEAKARAQQVLDAQRCRGLATRGGLARVRALAPLVGPLVASLVAETDERALALDARAFRPGRRRTSLTPVGDPIAERVARKALSAAMLALFAWRFLA